MKRKLLAVFLAFSMLTSFVLAGCGTPQSTIPTYQPSEMCSTLYVVSNCKDCSGYILINRRNTGVYLAPWKSVSLTIPEITCGEVVRVQLLNAAGLLSHTEVRTATFNRIMTVQFDWFN